MKIFTWKKAAAGAALLSLFACGDDSSSSSKTPDIFSTKDDLPECTEKIAGDTLYVESDSADYFCDDGEWVIVGDTSATDTSDVSSSSGKNPSSSSADSSAADTLSSSSAADSLSSSSSAEVSSSSAISKEVVLACPDTLTGNSIYVDGDSLVLENFHQFNFSAYTGNAILLDEDYLMIPTMIPVQNSMLGDSAMICSASLGDSAMCAMTKKGGRFSAGIDSAKTYGPWLVMHLKMPNTPENRTEILNYANSKDMELCYTYWVNLYGCLGQNGTDVSGELQTEGYGDASADLRMGFEFKGKAKYSADSAAALKIALADIEAAIESHNWTKVAALTGLKSSDPYMELFKITSIDYSVYGSGNVSVSFSAKDYSNRSMMESLLQSDCKDIDNHWITKIPLDLSAVSSSSAKSSSSSAKSSSSVSSSSVASSSSAESSSSAPTVFNDENLDFLAALAPFTKDEGASSLGTTVWTAQQTFLSTQATKLKAFANSLLSGLSDAGYTLASESTTTKTYRLQKGGSTYLVIIKSSIDSKQTSVNITAKKIES
ncbi:hypothetical protein SAMN05720469_11374 [Fibrobacter intestinalis]|uniref:Uncharacterized protein n=1 Tax=Fibrobacter intestinalis TaxID=28122 RepID=A0A1M6UEC6_9BACT|nr:hypothetical protein [Fibrobacter intestinalis]SHK67595.1 hypothetical protein SAMN05720469_11374 [Fibrobacter intestinalis]